MKRPTKDHRCGTRAGYQAHRRRGEDACKACKKGNSVEVTASKNRLNEPVPLQECGTRAAYLRHLAAGEEPCGPCREAARVYGQSRRVETGRKRPTKDPRCGTRAGYLAHRRRGEDGCGACLGAATKDSLDRRKTPGLKGSLPIVAPEDAHKAPCTDPRNGYIWDPQHEGERLPAVLDRWKTASLLCTTTCPVLAHCEASKAMAGGSGVWAGRIPEVTR